jgi:ABC-2 type transport system permease protein
MLKKQIKNYRYTIILLRQLVVTDFKLRYQNSFLGYIWSVLKPLALFSIMYVVFTKFLKVGNSIPNFPVYLLLGLVLWFFFSEVTNNSVQAIVGKGDLLRKINFPKYVIILAASFSALINLGLNLVVLLVIAFFAGADPSKFALLAPLYILELYIFAIGVSFFLSALFVKFRDIAYIWEIFMQALFYATPVFYDFNIVPAKFAKILMLNPLAQIIQDIRYGTVTKVTKTLDKTYYNFYIKLVPFIIVIGILVVGGLYFKNKSKYFAEQV